MEERRLKDSLGNTIGGEKENVHKDTSVSLNDLPNEVLISIFSNLDPLQLASVRLVSKQWNRLIQEDVTWIKSFWLKFGTGKAFPSVSRSRYWVVEYLYRMKVLKKWKKSIAIHRSYRLLTNDYGYLDFVLTDFMSDRLLAFSSINGDVSMCSLSNGKNQVFIPGNHLFTNISSYSVSWRFLFVAKTNAELFLKDLSKSTASASSRSSVIQLTKPEDCSYLPIIGSCINSLFDKNRENVQCITCSVGGKVQLWKLNGELLLTIDLDEPLINIKSDFRTYIIVQGVNLFVIDYRTLEVRKVGLDLDTSEYRSFLDVDFGGYNAIVSHRSIILLINFSDVDDIKVRSLLLPKDITVVKAKLQTMPEHHMYDYDPKLAGSDGLIYANLLSDGSVILWNVRSSASAIEVQCTINPIFSKRHPVLPPNVPPATSFALNGSVIVIGGYNGFASVYNIFTGEYIKECSVKFALKLSLLYSHVMPIQDIQLNESTTSTNGVIVCGNFIQYFQFGDAEKDPIPHQSKKKLNVGRSSKLPSTKDIKMELEDYNRLEESKRQRALVYESINGPGYQDLDDELSMAIAMSQSCSVSEKTGTDGENMDEERQLQLALELSKSESENPPTDEGELLERTLRLSSIIQ